METRNEMDINPFTWQLIQNNAPLSEKLIRVFKYHLNDDKTFTVKLKTLFKVFKPLFWRNFSFYEGDMWLHWDWFSFKTTWVNRYEDISWSDDERLLRGECFNVHEVFVRYAWQSSWHCTHHERWAFEDEDYEWLEYDHWINCVTPMLSAPQAGDFN